MNKKFVALLMLCALLVPLTGCSLSMSSLSSSSPESTSSAGTSEPSSVPSSSSSSISLTPVKSFTITFKNWDESFLSSVTVEQGKDAVYDGATPSRPAGAQYNYVFTGWDLPLTDIQADGDRIAQYSNALNRYMITFLNDDGSELQKSAWEYGTTPSYSGKPTKPMDAEKSYIFSNWFPKIATVSKEATYTAQYVSMTRQYTITFLNYDGSELQKSDWYYGSTPACAKVPSRPGTGRDSYVFSGWSPEIVPVTAVAAYTANFTTVTNSYTITFLNYDGTELQKSDWVYGSTPVYNGIAPTKPEDAGYTYPFSGWTPTIVPVAAKATYQATFAKVAKNTEGIVYTLAKDGKSYEASGYTGTATEVIVAVEYKGLPVHSIAREAFEKCTGITSVTIPDSITTIGDSAFCGCTALTAISLPNSVTTLDPFSFCGCTALTSAVLPASLTTTGEGTFKGCTSLVNVTIPSSVTMIAESCFSDCSGLKSITIPNSVRTIELGAFGSCTGLLSITLPDSVITLANSAFDGCTALTSVKTSSALTSIGSYAFSYCKSLQSIIIPKSVTTIGEHAFKNQDATNLNIYCEATSQPAGWDATWNDPWTYGGAAAYWYSATKKAHYWHYVNGAPTFW
jgi:hypothetical protein